VLISATLQMLYPKFHWAR